MSQHQYPSMGSRPVPQLKTEQFDMDTFFDFNQGTNNQSPIIASSGSPFDKEDQQQRFNGPSHDYDQFKQQVGLPVGSMASMPSNCNGMFDGGFNSGIDEMGFSSGFGWNSGLDMDGDVGMDFNAQPNVAPMFFPSKDTSSNNYVNPHNVGGQEEPQSNVGRLWPGMHSQQAHQAAMQKAAQAAVVQQRQLKLQAQQAQYRQAANSSQSQSSQTSSQPSQPSQPAQQSNGSGKRASHVTEPHVEESISRLLNQMRQNSAASDDAESPSNLLPHIARMKKDEEEMDEDERLLASEEGKKLSSKERRQLRNKVSARAFRSRRKEYISQLEGEVALKTQEANTYRQENQALMQENERYRGLIETLLRHPAFTPFINEISKDPSSLPIVHQPSQQQQPQPQPQQPPQQQQQPQPQTSVTSAAQMNQAQSQQEQSQQELKQGYPLIDASKIMVPQPKQEPQQQVGLAMVPENDFSKLNINGFNSMNFNNFSSVNAYAVTEMSAVPDPVDLLSDSPVSLQWSAFGSTCSSENSSINVLLAKLDNTARKLDHCCRIPAA